MSANKIREGLGRFSKPTITAIGLLLVVLLGFVDHITGPQISVAIFYLIPVLLVSWYAGIRPSALIGVLSALTWLLADITAGARYAQPAIRYWNASVMLGFFIIIAALVSNLRRALDREQQRSRIDFLTGVYNARAFNEIADAEQIRARRYEHPITVAYLDIDDFKKVNDEFGHPTGDALLVWVGKTLRESLRSTDMVARVGGDEFAILLPETAEEASRVVLEKLHRVLRERMKQHDWPVTFSIGAATFLTPPESLEQMIGEADRLMYAAKRGGKNKVEQAVVG